MSPRPIRTTRRLAAALVGGAALGVTVLAGPASAAPGCATAWGSTPEIASGPGSGAVDEIRTGQHACFDRIVIDVDGAHGDPIGYRVEYVDQVTHDSSGAVIPLRGNADLRIVVTNPAYEGGAATYDPANDAEAEDVAGYRTLRQVAWAGSAEGVSSIGVGVRARLPYRVTVLPGPGDDARLVVDVAHTW